MKNIQYCRVVFLSLFLAALSLTSARAASGVVAWGSNDSGQSTVPALTNPVAVAAGGLHSVALQADGTVVAWGDNSYHQTEIPIDLTDVRAIAADYYNTVALKNDGTVVMIGDDIFGDFPAGLSDVKAIAAGKEHFLALKNDGTVVGWGANFNGQLDAPLDLTNAVTIAAGEQHSFAIRADGTIARWGTFYSEEPPVDATGFVSVAAGNDHGIALKTDGTVISWGSIGYWLPYGMEEVVAIAAGSTRAFAIHRDGTAEVWGYSYTGNGEDMIPGDLANVSMISVGDAHNLAITNDGAPMITTQPINRTVPQGLVTLTAYVSASTAPTYEWYVDGSLVGASSEPTLALTLSQIGDVDYYYIATTPAGSVTSATATLSLVYSDIFVWGYDPKSMAAAPWGTNRVAISAGQDHALALRDDGTVLGWGDDALWARDCSR